MSTSATTPTWQPFVDGLAAFVARRVPEQVAEDVLQDVLLRLHQHASTLRDVGRAESWVYGVARRTIADYYRARGPRLTHGPALEPDDIPAPAAPEPRGFAAFEGDHEVHEEVLSWLRPMAEELPEKYARPLLMADFEGRPQQEVADELGLTLSGAKSRVQRARAMLGAALRRCCEVELDAEGRAVDFRRRSCDC